jgi:anti-sigma factor RsiW
MTRRPSACDILVERLSAFLDGDLSPADCRRLSAHARRCARCRALTKELRATVGECQRAASVPLPPAVRRRAQAGIRALLSRPKTS